MLQLLKFNKWMPPMPRLRMLNYTLGVQYYNNDDS